MGRRATDCEVRVDEAVLAARSEKAAAPSARPVAVDREAPPRGCTFKVGATTTARLAWILAEGLSEPGRLVQPDE